jgi:hypothetical protein
VAILADIEAGAEPLTFTAATREKCLRRDGRRHHVAWVYRQADPSRPFPLESAVIGGVRVTTRPAIMRWIARNSGVHAAPGWTPGRMRREHESSERELERAGF